MKYDSETLRSLQLLELTILKDIDYLCKKHAIPYFLEGGSALGAVRHKGFIPWDDDIDIAMLRPDYEHFLKVARCELGEEYEISDPVANEHHAAMFAKVWLRGTKFYTKEALEAGVLQGVFVDIIPYDRLCDNKAEARRQKRACRFWQSVSYLYHAETITVPHHGFLGVLEKTACRLFHFVIHSLYSPQKIYSAYQAAATRGANSKEDGTYMSLSLVMKHGYPLSVLMPPKPAQFEDTQVLLPAQAVKYLQTMFGDTWSELPPLQDRKNHAPVELDLGDFSTVSS